MNKKCFQKNILKMFNNKGMGLIGVMVAAALVVVAAFTVANFVSDQYKRSAKLEISGNCQNIANSIVEYIKKDEASLFISSYGPTSNGTYPQGLDKTDDGIDRFRFTNAPLPAFTYTGTPSMTLDPAPVPLPNTWKYFNHLNIKNSTNRLVALAASGNYCCNGLDMRNPNCGARFYDDNMKRPGFAIADKDVEVDLAVEFKGIACTGRRLAIADLPDSRSATIADFKVQVTMYRGTPQQKICSGTGSVQRAIDSSPSLTILEYVTNLCGGSIVAPAICGASRPVQIAIRTYKQRSGTTCTTQCLQKAESRTCDQLGASSVDLFDTFGNANCRNNCLESDPGTAFLCRIGEKSWFDDPNNKKTWEPCETATVKDHDGSTAGTVSITYNPLIAGNTRTQKTSNAILTLNGLRTMRGYVVDVRAIDTAGNIGMSFCDSGSPSCLDTSPPHFTIIDSNPVMGPITDAANFVDFASLQEGGVRTLINTAPPKYNNALDAFAGQKFQCQDGGPQLTGTVQYTPAAPVGPKQLGHTCSGVLDRPTGANVNIPEGTGTPGCSCDGVNCTAKLPVGSTNGPYKLTLTASNDCGPLPTIPDQNWCMDKNKDIQFTHLAAQDFETIPNFSATITPPTATNKPCGISTLCPSDLSNGFTPVTGTSCTPPALTGWNENSHSGCIPDPKGNFCAVVIDPCGRYESTNQPAPVDWSTTLNSVAYNAAPASNYCFNYNGNQVGGNVCESGSYCSISGKCFSNCAKAGDACSNAVDCEDPSYGVTSAEAGGPRCVGGRCTCPTNTSSPAASNCAPKYCPILNSCPIALTPTNPAGGTCQGCSNWTIGKWSLCINGNKTRTVSCSGTCCVGPKPIESTTCPDCVSPWNTEVKHGASVTAYQTASVGCGGDCDDVKETRRCNNGTLSGSFTNQTCTVDTNCGSGGWECGGPQSGQPDSACSSRQDLCDDFDARIASYAGQSCTNAGERKELGPGCVDCGSSGVSAIVECRCKGTSGGGAGTWQTVGGEDIGCNLASCGPFIGASCPTLGAVKMCCASTSRKQELECKK